MEGQYDEWMNAAIMTRSQAALAQSIRDMKRVRVI